MKKLIIPFILLAPTWILAQEPIQEDTARVRVNYADIFEYLLEGDTLFQKLIGSVELQQDSIYMYCDSAVILNEQDVVARGRVQIQQSDSVSIFADSVLYSGLTRDARLYGDVVLVNGRQKLYTDSLSYNLRSRIASYQGGAVLTNDTTQLTSRIGYYYVATHNAFFKDSVVLIDPNFELKSDTLQFNTQTQVATFLGPTLIVQEKSKIYCEQGFYDIPNQRATFSQNPQFVQDSVQATARVIRYDGEAGTVSLEGDARYVESTRVIAADTLAYNEKKNAYRTSGRSKVVDPPQILEADQIDFERESGTGLAWGRVVWQDTTARISIFCDTAQYREQDGYFRATGGRPMLITEIDSDSMYLSADTLVAFQQDTLLGDSSRVLLAYRDARIYKKDLQAVCDSLSYETRDSVFRLFDQPIIWTDTTQLMADTVLLVLANQKVDQVLLQNNAMIINTIDFVFFNQIKGRNIQARFWEDALNSMHVVGNAESVYFATDETDAYIGANKTTSGEMRLRFEGGKLQEIRFYTQPQGNFQPIQEVDQASLTLPGFRWDPAKRPLFPEDVKKPTPR